MKNKEGKKEAAFYDRLSALEGTVRRVLNHGRPEERSIDVVVQGTEAKVIVEERDGSEKLISKHEIGEDGTMNASVIVGEREPVSSLPTLGEKVILKEVESALEQYESRH